MKWPKSRKAKNSASSSGSLGTTPGCREASSETIRGEADPTWCTCSSALGRRAMKSVSADMAPSMSALGDEVLHLVRHLRGRPLEHLVVDHDGRCPLDVGLAGGEVGGLDERRVLLP